MTERIEIKDCPSPSCQSDDVDTTRSSTKTGYLWFVRCNECVMDGPVMDNRDAAVDIWNEMLRVDDAEEEEDDATIVTLVRMLDETRTQQEALKDEYIELNGASHDLQKKNEALDAMLQQCKASERKESAEKEVDSLKDRLSKDLKNAQEALRESDTSIRGHKKVLAYIDLELMKLRGELSEGLGLIKETPRDLHFLDALIKDVRTDHAFKKVRSEGPERIIYNLIDLVGPYGSHTNMKIYEAAVSSLAGDDKEKQDVFGMVISTFPQEGTPYNIAYDALGRPGATVHVRHPRT